MVARALIFMTISVCLRVGLSLRCKNEAGTEVDWWFMIKYPDAASQSLGGAYYSAMDSESKSWAASSISVESSSSILGVNLDPIYASPKGDISYVFYSDQHPDGTWTRDYGHSKGVIAYDSESGFFLQHSVPKFPNYVDQGYHYGSGQEKFGQHALCVSLELATLDQVAFVMKYSHPWVYDSHLAAAPKLANVSDVVKEVNFNATASFIDLTISTSNSLGDLRLFGKTALYNKDMMDSVVAPALKFDLWSQSWLNSGGTLGAYCPKGFSVLDVQTSNFGSATEPWKTNDDHSKWAIAPMSDWVCGNDNNRVYSQFERSGLSICFQQPDIHSTLKSGVKKEGNCGPSPPEGECCYYKDTSCKVGDVCCKSGCKDPFTCSYTEEGCSGRYGQKHHCTWQNDTCFVGSSATM